MSDYDFTFDLSMKYTQADFDAITDEEFEKTTEVFLYNRKGEEFHFIKPKVGEWIELNNNKDGFGFITHNIQCTYCRQCVKSKGHANSFYTAKHFSYCPHCGAEMRTEF